MREMLEAGLHFGHQTRRWNPKMKPYIYGPRNGIYIINLDATMKMFRTAYTYIQNAVADGGSIMFVGTKRQAQAIMKEQAIRCDMFYVNHRWLGGMMTNFQTVKNSVDRLKKIESMQEDGSINRFPKKEILKMEKERIKLERNVGGIKNMRKLPDVLFVIDPRKEEIAISEAKKLGIPVVALTDTNCSPDGIEHLIPGNDDAIRAIRLITTQIANAVMEGKGDAGEEVGDLDAMEAKMTGEQVQEAPPVEAPTAEATTAEQATPVEQTPQA
ncbi:MAG: 30S ribosomal protein S2 [Candidatus Electrothrix sp. GM3_4]|nr:30S ribosomal protein S2 [Candidatus Electrothrix sp. GM3_4]